MTHQYTVKLTDQTIQAIEDQTTYIAVDSHAPLNAAKWLDRVLEGIQSLSMWPRRCAKAEEDAYRSYEIRKLNIDGYLLIFTIDDDLQTVWIISFRSARMKPQEKSLPKHKPQT